MCKCGQNTYPRGISIENERRKFGDGEKEREPSIFHSIFAFHCDSMACRKCVVTHFGNNHELFPSAWFRKCSYIEKYMWIRYQDIDGFVLFLSRITITFSSSAEKLQKQQQSWGWQKVSCHDITLPRCPNYKRQN